MLRHLPNLITIFRFALVPVLIVLLQEGNYLAAFVVFVTAGLSDGLDGLIARRWHFESHLGGILDPLADKTLMAASTIMLTLLGHIPLWVLIIILGRDFLIIGGYLAYTSQHGAIQMKASLLGKLNTLFQILLVALILAEQARVLSVPYLVPLVLYSTAIMTVLSGVHYYWSWIIEREVQTLGEDKAANKDDAE